MTRKVKVAVVGSGLAGLTAAHLLNRPCSSDDIEVEVHLFEKSSSLGMDSASLSLTSPEQPWRIDVPMRSFQGGYYTQLIELYKSLGVQFREADFSYSFSNLSLRDENRSITTTFIYNGASGRAGFAKPSNFDSHCKLAKEQTFIPLVRRIWTSCQIFIFLLQNVLCFLITFYHSVPIRRPGYLENIVFHDWVQLVAPRSYLARFTGMDVAWESYVQMVLVPMFSAVCTSPSVDIMNHPMEEFLDYIWLTFGTHHYVVVGGVHNVVSRLAAGLQHINLSSTILSIEPDPQHCKCVSLTILSDGQVKESSGFHHLIFATQAPAAVPLLTTYLKSLPDRLSHRKEKISAMVQCLKGFQSRHSMVINHTDDTLLPDHSHDIRELNLISLAPGETQATHSPAKFYVPSTYTMATQILRRPKGYPLERPPVFQSTNPIISPRKESIISVATLERALVTKESKKALASLCEKDTQKWWQCPYQARTRLGPLQGCRPTEEPDAPGFWVCGSFAHGGIPLLEGCVISARNVVEQGILRSEGTGWREEPWAMKNW